MCYWKVEVFKSSEEVDLNLNTAYLFSMSDVSVLSFLL